MIVLNLTLEKKWFDLILSGTKKEEYRNLFNRQVARLWFHVASGRSPLPDNPIVLFRNGYNMDSPALTVELLSISPRDGNEAQHPEWGEPTSQGLHLVLKLGKVLSSGLYRDVRDSISPEEKAKRDKQQYFKFLWFEEASNFQEPLHLNKEI